MYAKTKPNLIRRIVLAVTIALVSSPIWAQCDSSTNVRDAFEALRIDDDLPFLKTAPILLQPDLDKESIAILEDGLSRKYFTRQLEKDGHIYFDTLYVSDDERKQLDAYSRQPRRKWTIAAASSCRLGREVKMYKKSMEEGGVLRNTYQIAEPIFLRNNTIALMFYKREKPSGYGEFTVLVRKGEKWEQWNKIIITITSKQKR